MPRLALTSDQIEEFRDRAVEVATRLFAERGYEGMTMRALATELGCSPMTPYRYFENREELFGLVRVDAFRRFADQQERAYLSGEDTRDTLVKLKQAYIDFAVEEPNAYSIMFQLTPVPRSDFPNLNEESYRGFSYLVKATHKAVEEGMFEGDPLTIAHILWSNTHGLVSLHLSGRLLAGRSLEELAEVVLEAPNL